MSNLEQLERYGFVVIPSAITREECKAVLATAEKAAQNRLPTMTAGLNDSEDEFNVVYDSNRSPGVQYMYLVETRANAVNRRIAEFLTTEFKTNFLAGINGKCLPLFSYGEGSFIKAHRGRDIGFGANDLVAVGMLTRPGYDYLEGQFYLNSKAIASVDGKNVWNDLPADRQHFALNQGDLLVFNNNRFVHGTTPTGSIEGYSHRVTCSWRAERERRTHDRAPTFPTKPLARQPEIIVRRARA